MRRMAGDILKQRPVVPTFNPEDLLASAEYQPFLGNKHEPTKFPGRRKGTGTR